MTDTSTETHPLPEEASRALDQSGRSLADLAKGSPVLVLFLRHTGCTFCREALAELSQRRGELESQGIVPAVVHLQSADEPVRQLLTRYGLDDVPRIGDPGQKLYAAFGLARGTAGSVLGPRVWWRGFETTVLRGHLPGRPAGDVFQLPGAFLIGDGQILAAFRAETSAERVPWDRLSSCTGGACELPAPTEANPSVSSGSED